MTMVVVPATATATMGTLATVEETPEAVGREQVMVVATMAKAMVAEAKVIMATMETAIVTPKPVQ